MKKWRCTVCGYVHTGNELPDKCPVCGADKSLFEEIEAKVEPVTVEEQDKKQDETPADTASGNESPAGEIPDDETLESDKSRIYNTIVSQLLKHHAHPISVHFPNGVLPMSVLFIFLAVAFEMKDLEITGFYTLIFVVFTLPFVLFTGYLEWKNKYGGHLTKIFLTKIICAIIVTGAAVCAVLWRFADPKVMDVYSPDRWTYVLLCLTMLGAAIVAGMIGGKLVFKD
ncbi:rubredoxin-like domain-containing protein [Desulfonema limicola]|uniref:Rubredoxin-like domain-containing protein n=1 Tax=Desulfonema limicola TaxID=45656 RepID=A0A975BE00_9BACT|nr:DUF2231 domain-containing protein [Desulfonema limicola]QTA83929.1 rubredoxin-like domain-containing protein [Desulfonema limicola]